MYKHTYVYEMNMSINMRSKLTVNHTVVNLTSDEPSTTALTITTNINDRRRKLSKSIIKTLNLVKAKKINATNGLDR